MSKAPIHAILTPVPVVHLREGQDVCRRTGKVAFGTRAYDFFEDRTVGQSVLIYASMNDGDARPLVTWDAVYEGFVRAENWTTRQRRTYRPISCLRGDEEAYWAGFYLVSSLRHLATPVEIRTLGDAQGKRYRQGFVPEGPIAVTVPN